MLSKLFKLFGKCYHCYHCTNERYKVKADNKNGCKNYGNEYTGFGQCGVMVKYVIKEVCCKCGKVKWLHCEDYNIGRGLAYPEYIEPDDGFRYDNVNKL